MNCEHYLDLISARLDGELSAGEQAELDSHLQECPACRAIAKELEGLHSALADLGKASAPTELSRRVMSKINAEQQTKSRRIFRSLLSLAACLALCVTAWYSSLPDPSSDPQLLSDAWDAAEADAQNIPGAARFVAEDPKFKALPLSIDAYSLSQAATDFVPPARLLDSADGLERFLARFPEDDLSQVTNTYDEIFFFTRRLLAVEVQEPSSSITHAVSELTEDHITILQDTSVPGDAVLSRWLLLIPTELAGPERDLAVTFLEQP